MDCAAIDLLQLIGGDPGGRFSYEGYDDSSPTGNFTSPLILPGQDELSIFIN